MSQGFRAFLTGSYAYGIPSEKSDIDLVIFCTQEDLQKLCTLADEDICTEKGEAYTGEGSIPLRFGKLNLLCCTDEKMYQHWMKGTKLLKRQAPVNRDFAIRFMEKVRNE